MEVPYIAAVYSSAAPPPQPPSLVDLPWEAEARAEQERERERAIRDAKAAEAKRLREAERARERSRGSGWSFGSVVSSLVQTSSDVAHVVRREGSRGVDAASKAARTELLRWSEKKWTNLFPTIAAMPAEKLWISYSGRLIAGGRIVRGDFFISDTFLSFAGSFVKDDVEHQVKATIDLRTVLSLQRAVVVVDEAAPAGTPPRLARAEADAIPDALRIFDANRHVHLVYGVSKADEFYNVLDHAWRAVAPPGSSHLQGEHTQPSAPPMDVEHHLVTPPSEPYPSLSEAAEPPPPYEAPSGGLYPSLH